nr:hypothetical protein [Oceaniferula marina]
MRSRSPLNARSQKQDYEGVLLRAFGGYACVHPWPELGDLPLDAQLQSLRQGQTTALLRSALSCAKADGRARKLSVSLFDGLDVPVSHASCYLEQSAVESAVAAGFDTVKVKMGRDLAVERRIMQEISAEFPSLRWRIDLNHSQPFSQVRRWLATWGREDLARVDFIEDAWCPDVDPCPDGRGVQVPLAIDRDVENVVGSFPVWILKPAVNDMPLAMKAAVENAHGPKVVVTSYMDHPLGQSYAAWQAAMMAKSYPGVVSKCGLVTHGLFEPDEFTEMLGRPKPGFSPADGTGLGFDQLLESLPWKRLV